MDNQDKGQNLNAVSKVLFDQASLLWYGALILDLLVAIASLITQNLTLEASKRLWIAIGLLSLVIVAYAMRLLNEARTDDAETMRRQSALTEGLDWPIGRTQLSKWRQKAGTKVLQKVEQAPRDAAYYSSSQEKPGPSKLLSMTVESAFWSRRLYGVMRNIAWVLCIALVVITLLVVGSVVALPLDNEAAKNVMAVIYTFLPTILVSINIFGIAFRLTRLVEGIAFVEEGLEDLERSTPELHEVLRLVYEYNCLLTSAVPIPKLLFRVMEGSLNKEWEGLRT